MNEYLTCLGEYVGVLLEQLSALSYVGVQPWIDLVDFPIEYATVYESEKEFDDYPQIDVPGVVGQCYLQESLDDSSRLEIGYNDVVLLVCRQEYLPVVDEVANQRGGQEGEECKIYNTQSDRRIVEYQWEEQGYDSSNEAYAHTYHPIYIPED